MDRVRDLVSEASFIREGAGLEPRPNLFSLSDIELFPEGGRARGTDGPDTLYGAGSDVWGFGGNDKIYITSSGSRVWAGDGNDQIWGDGHDTPPLRPPSVGHASAFQAAPHEEAFAPAYTYTDPDHNLFQGQDGDDTIFAGEASSTLAGGNGDDFLIGHKGSDTLDGGFGNDLLRDLGSTGYGAALAMDTMDGGGGNDTVCDSLGSDVLIGGNGTDTVNCWQDESAVHLNLQAGTISQAVGADHDQISGFENAVGSAYNDLIYGDAGANRLDGGAGEDTLYGQAGKDTLTGGSNVDRFYFATGDSTAGVGFDVITDLTQGDIIDLAAIDANKVAAGDQAFVLVAQFTGHAGELTLYYDASLRKTMIAGDRDGDKAADLLIAANGHHETFTHFVL